jgi:hypothetical protein
MNVRGSTAIFTIPWATWRWFLLLSFCAVFMGPPEMPLPIPAYAFLLKPSATAFYVGLAGPFFVAVVLVVFSLLGRHMAALIRSAAVLFLASLTTVLLGPPPPIYTLVSSVPFLLIAAAILVRPFGVLVSPLVARFLWGSGPA